MWHLLPSTEHHNMLVVYVELSMDSNRHPDLSLSVFTLLCWGMGFVRAFETNFFCSVYASTLSTHFVDDMIITGSDMASIYFVKHKHHL